MKVLICNNHFNMKNTAPSNQISGAWITNLIQEISKDDNIELNILMRGNFLETTEKNGISYHVLPVNTMNREVVALKHIHNVLNAVKPDILHVEGTEMLFARRVFDAFDGHKVVSIQGLVSEIAKYEFTELNLYYFIQNKLWKAVIIYLMIRLNFYIRFYPKISNESKILTKGSNFIGRTDWDCAHLKSVNKAAKYFDCPRVISEEFMNANWYYKNKNSTDFKVVFIGNCSTPRKGLHIAVRALILLLERNKNITVRIAGQKPKSTRIPRYIDLVNELIKYHNVQEYIQFTGPLDRAAMAKELMNCDAYLLPSVIENSPNTLAEAMMVGVPIVAAAVGGVPSMVQDDREALLYRAEDSAMAAFQLERVLNSEVTSKRLSTAAKKRALSRHDVNSIKGKMKLIYSTIKFASATKNDF